MFAHEQEFEKIFHTFKLNYHTLCEDGNVTVIALVTNSYTTYEFSSVTVLEHVHESQV